MSLPYQVLGNVTGSIFSGSYLSETDTPLLFRSNVGDLWFGFSPNDTIEISTYNTQDDSLVSWGVVENKKIYKDVTLSYIDDLDRVQTFSYQELQNQFLTYKNDRILVNPINHLHSIGIMDGSYKVSYVFNRFMAGDSTNTLSIKQISPSRKEIKLVPSKETSIQYSAFCQKKFPVSDVSPVLISAVKQCPYDQIYQRVKDQYEDEIEFLKFIFFLPDDGSVLTFLRNVYEDFIKYTSLSEEEILDGSEPTRILRIQGIRTYFNNYLLTNYNSISDFTSIEDKFKEFTNRRLDQRFGQFSVQQGDDYKGARRFVYEFFVLHFYENVVKPIEETYRIKYLSFFKNVLNFGNNRYFPILVHDFLDERVEPTDPLTLVIKLASELPSDIAEKNTCWVSNFSMVPYVFTAILRNPTKYRTVKISPANFNLDKTLTNRENTNQQFAIEDLEQSNLQISHDITINQRLARLNIDYSDFSNFIVFSSISDRLNVFKNKIKQYYTFSGSLASLEISYLNSLSSSTVYPYYQNNKDLLTTQIDEVVDSFDGFESYLFKQGFYQYSTSSATFVSASYVEDQDELAAEYDKSNRDSLINNTPDFIKLDENNDEYLTFLSMTGHHFDNIYSYISSVPIERQVQNELTSSLPTKTLQEILTSYGWNVDDVLADLNVDEVYLNSLDSSTYNAISAEERLRTIWNRILISLPGIYKTKGSEECVRFLLSCYGIPSNLLSIREFGGIDFTEEFKQTYVVDEKVFMTKYSGNNDHIQGPFPNNIETVEFKFSIENPEGYIEQKFNPLFTKYPYSYNQFPSHSWAIGFKKVAGEFLGEIIFEMGSGSNGQTITSSVLPIFNGDVFSVMLRRNNPIERFENSEDVNAVPLRYDLYVQRNENGRKIFCSTSSIIMEAGNNRVFSNPGIFKTGNGYFPTGNQFNGTLDKVQLWDEPISDVDFNNHVNDFNSYSYSGSIANQHLWVRLSWDYPQLLYFNLSGSSSLWVDNRSSYYALPNFYSSQSLSSSLIPSLYSASVDITNNRWRTNLPSGSAQLTAFNFQRIIDPNWTSSFDSSSCVYLTDSAYPFSFRELLIQNGLDISKYGPNKFKNDKITKIELNLDARLDVNERSTTLPNALVTPDSNLLGLFIDPQDSKNKDMSRYIGSTGVIDIIGDPEDIYRDRYPNLKNKNSEYHAFGNKKTLFNELITVYKFFFDKSVFSAIKNTIPARANIVAGVVVEPTLLERPKYQSRPITSSVARSLTFEANTTRVSERASRLSMSLEWANFNTNFSESSQTLLNSLPPSYNKVLDLTYINNPIREFPRNWDGNQVPDFYDSIQFTTYPDYENCLHPEVTSSNVINGSLSRRKNGDTPQVNQSFYLLKVWEKKNIYELVGPYTHSNVMSDNTYISNSIYLYKYITVDQPFMDRMVYMKTNDPSGVNDPSPTFFGFQYTHSINTFKNTPDQTINVLMAININVFDPSQFDLVPIDNNTFFEIVSGYPRNHYIHKRQQFTPDKYSSAAASEGSSSVYVKGRQTISTTIGLDGIDDGTFPVQTINVNNVNIVNSDNVLEQ